MAPAFFALASEPQDTILRAALARRCAYRSAARLPALFISHQVLDEHRIPKGKRCLRYCQDDP